VQFLRSSSHKQTRAHAACKLVPCAVCHPCMQQLLCSGILERSTSCLFLTIAQSAASADSHFFYHWHSCRHRESLCLPKRIKPRRTLLMSQMMSQPSAGLRVSSGKSPRCFSIADCVFCHLKIGLFSKIVKLQWVTGRLVGAKALDVSRMMYCQDHTWATCLLLSCTIAVRESINTPGKPSRLLLTS